jgi:hypothetical protein
MKKYFFAQNYFFGPRKKKDPLFYFRKTRRIWTALNLTNPPSFWLGRNYFGSKVTALSVKTRPYLRFTQNGTVVRLLKKKKKKKRQEKKNNKNGI